MYCIFQLAYLLTFSVHPFSFLDSHQLLPGHRVLDSRERESHSYFRMCFSGRSRWHQMSGLGSYFELQLCLSPGVDYCFWASVSSPVRQDSNTQDVWGCKEVTSMETQHMVIMDASSAVRIHSQTLRVESQQNPLPASDCGQGTDFFMPQHPHLGSRLLITLTRIAAG